METYSIIVSCTNCSFSGSVAIVKGKKVSSEPCPRCGCKCLSAKFPL